MILILLILLAVPVYGQFSTQLSGPVTIVGGALNVASGTTNPSGTLGSVFANTSSSTVQIHNGSGWVDLLGYTGALDKNTSIVYDGSAWVTELPVYGEIYNTNVGAVTINAAYDTLINLSTSGELGSFDRIGRALKYTGSYAIKVLVQYNLSAESIGATVLYTRVRQNTTSVTKSTSIASFVEANDIYPVSNSCILTLQPNDLIWIESAADTNSTSFTIYNANLIITKI
jgi:hypothetical protein